MAGGGCWTAASSGPSTATYPVHKDPPWGLSILFALQHLLVQTSVLLVCHFLLFQNLSLARQNQNQLLATSFFICGISTGLQATLGSRLPLVQAPSFELLIPAMLFSRQTLLAPRRDGNGTEESQVCSGQHCNTSDVWNQPIREVSGAVLIAGMLQVLFAISGLCGLIIQRSGPMVLAPTLSIIGLSSYKEAALASSAHWGAALLLVLLTALLSQNLRCCFLPLWTWDGYKGCRLLTYFPAFRMLSVLLPVCCTWIVCVILNHAFRSAEGHSTPVGQLDAENISFTVYAQVPTGLTGTTTGHLATKNGAHSAPWLKIPYPGELGWPLLSTRALSMGIAMAMASSMNSLGCYALCARVLCLPSLPRQACNRGVCMEAVGKILCGVMGSVCGAASSIPNACTGGLTQVGSRHSVLVSALMCLILGSSPKLTEFLSTIPMAVHGGVLCVTYGVAVGAGLSFFQYSDIDSGRNIFIVGFTMFIALLLPRWLNASPDYVSTGWVSVDLLLLSLLTIPVSLGGLFSFFLDNTISGTLEERGLKNELSLWQPYSDEDAVRGRKQESWRVYGLPPIFSRWLPQSSLRETFPFRTLCPRDSEMEAMEEKETSPEEGATLLEKVISLQMEPIISIKQCDAERAGQSEC